MTQKSNSRIVIDTNKHGIRRETNLDKVSKKAQNKKKWEANPRWKKDIHKDKKLSTDNKDLSTEISTDI
jgi:hypothetical protein